MLEVAGDLKVRFDRWSWKDGGGHGGTEDIMIHTLACIFFFFIYIIFTLKLLCN